MNLNKEKIMQQKTVVHCKTEEEANEPIYEYQYLMKRKGSTCWQAVLNYSSVEYQDIEHEYYRLDFTKRERK